MRLRSKRDDQSQIICFGCHLLATSCACSKKKNIKEFYYLNIFPLFFLFVRAAGPAVGAAADSPTEKLPGLHGSCRPLHLLPGTPPPVQGPVISGLRFLLPDQRPHARSSSQASLYHRSASPSSPPTEASRTVCSFAYTVTQIYNHCKATSRIHRQFSRLPVTLISILMHSGLERKKNHPKIR